jgi:hypothetical protein
MGSFYLIHHDFWFKTLHIFIKITINYRWLLIKKNIIYYLYIYIQLMIAFLEAHNLKGHFFGGREREREREREKAT